MIESEVSLPSGRLSDTWQQTNWSKMSPSERGDLLARLGVLPESYQCKSNSVSELCEVENVDDLPVLIKNYLYLAASPDGFELELFELRLDLSLRISRPE